MIDPDKKLYQQIDEILCYVWDPIGVSSNGFPEARDEYSRYVPEIHQAILDGATEEEIVKFLESIRTKTIGVDPDAEKDKGTAAAIFGWVKRLREQEDS